MADGAIPPCDAELTAALVMGAVLQPVVMHQYDQRVVAPIDQLEPIVAACVAILNSGDDRERGGQA